MIDRSHHIASVEHCVHALVGRSPSALRSTGVNWTPTIKV